MFSSSHDISPTLSSLPPSLPPPSLPPPFLPPSLPPSLSSSHLLQCTLERHSSAVHTSQWKGGALRIDPLATVQVSAVP